MKAKIVSQKVSEGVMDKIHGGGFTVKRLVVEEANNLAITPHKNEVYAVIGFDLTRNCQIIGEIDVPDELVEKALAFVLAKVEFDNLKDFFNTLLS